MDDQEGCLVVAEQPRAAGETQTVLRAVIPAELLD
jgi:hypothetical protein